jgi:hypothetical protein
MMLHIREASDILDDYSRNNISVICSSKRH